MKRIILQNRGPVAVITIFIVIFGVFWYATLPAEAPGYPAAEIPVYPAGNSLPGGSEAVQRPVVVVGSVEIPVEVRRTPTELRTGLSGRLSLPADSGMFFVFRTRSEHKFWMPDMHFPIDIIWITGGRIVGIEPNVPTDFDPADPVYYSPPVPVEHVLEVNAGFATRHGLEVGDTVTLRGI